MATHLVTGRAGAAHVTAADVGSLLAGIVGAGKYVLGTGDSFSAEIVSNNLIKIRSGDLLNQGRHIRISNDDCEECEIENGSQGLNRRDLIVMRYTRDVENDIETAEVVVIKGTPAESPKDPAYVTGDIIAGDLTDDFPLYRVCLNGISIEKVEKMFASLLDVKSIYDKLVAVNNLAAAAVPNSKITQSSAVTASGYVLDAREKNASISGTLAYMLNNFCGKLDLIWYNTGSNFTTDDDATSLNGYRITAPEEYMMFLIYSTAGNISVLGNWDNCVSYLNQFLNVYSDNEYATAIAYRKVTLEIAHVSSGGYFKNIVFDKAYYKGVAANSSTKPYNGSCVPLRIYGIRK